MHHMDHAFYHCVDYNGVRSYTPQQKVDMGRFLHPNIALNDGELAHTMFEGVHEMKRTGQGGVPREMQPTERGGPGGSKFFLPNSTVQYHLAQYQGILDGMNALRASS